MFILKDRNGDCGMGDWYLIELILNGADWEDCRNLAASIWMIPGTVED